MYLYNNGFDYHVVGNYILDNYFPDTPLTLETKKLFRDFLNGYFFKLLNPDNTVTEYGDVPNTEDPDSELGRMLFDTIPLMPDQYVAEIEAYDLDVNLFTTTPEGVDIFFPLILVRIETNGNGSN